MHVYYYDNRYAAIKSFKFKNTSNKNLFEFIY